jgi:hypothetical protein
MPVSRDAEIGCRSGEDDRERRIADMLGSLRKMRRMTLAMIEHCRAAGMSPSDRSIMRLMREVQQSEGLERRILKAHAAERVAAPQQPPLAPRPQRRSARRKTRSTGPDHHDRERESARPAVSADLEQVRMTIRQIACLRDLRERAMSFAERLDRAARGQPTAEDIADGGVAHAPSAVDLVKTMRDLTRIETYLIRRYPRDVFEKAAEDMPEPEKLPPNRADKAMSELLATFQFNPDRPN